MEVNKLGIFIITFNRASLLRRTLNEISSSLLRDFPITVVDNASTDDTQTVVEDARAVLPDITHIKNRVNIGANANFLRVFDYSDFEYTWILCDDDLFDLSKFNDVLEVLAEGKVELVHVGAHRQKKWILGGSYKTPRELLAAGYAYFKFSSFMPCNIFKTDLFKSEYLIQGYNNIGNAYPHMPFAIGLYLSDAAIYVAKHQIVFAQGGQFYSEKDWYMWWIKTSELLPTASDVRTVYLDQWKDDGNSSDEMGIESLLRALELHNGSAYVKNFISRYFTLSDKAKLRVMQLSHGINSARNKFYWYRVEVKNKRRWSN